MNNNTIIAGVIVGGAVLAAAGAIAYSSGYDPLQKYARVVSVTQAYDTTQTPRVVCGDEATLAQAQTTAAASAQGDVAGDFQSSAPPPPREEPAATQDAADAIPSCLTVYDTTSVEAGFDVTYEFDGVQSVVRMDRDPGRRIPIEDGELVVSRS